MVIVAIERNYSREEDRECGLRDRYLIFKYAIREGLMERNASE